MRIKNLIIYYPSFESGGVEKIIKNLIRFFILKGIKIFLITSNKQNLKIIKKNKNLKIILIKNNYYTYLPTRLSSSINSIKYLNCLLRKMNNSDTIVHSMQSNFIPIMISKILNFKVVIRNSEDPIESIKYSENKLFSYIIFINALYCFSLKRQILFRIFTIFFENGHRITLFEYLIIAIRLLFFIFNIIFI